ncbi:MAG: N-acetyltransferase family protein [Pseudohongiellaceae bacterium]
MLREFRDEDFPVILDIYNSSKLDELNNENEKFDLLPLLEDKNRLELLRESKIVVFEKSGVRGFGAYYENEVRGLFVHPNSRGNGIGRTMLEYLLEKIDDKALLYVTKSNFGAKAFYEQYGFNVTSEFETSYNGKSVIANEMRQVYDS